MKKIYIIILLNVFLICCSSVKKVPINIAISSPDWHKKITKLIVLTNVKDKYLQKGVENEYIKLLLFGNYTVVARAELKHILKEIKFQNSEITEGDATKYGKMMNVDAVLLVNINKWYGKKNSSTVDMSAKIISVESGDILWIASAREYPPIFLSKVIANKIPRKNGQTENADLVASGKWYESYDKIAVISEYKDSEISSMIEDETISLLIKRGYTVPTRSKIKTILKEKDFQTKSGLTEADAVKIGKLLNVKAIFIIEKDMNLKIGTGKDRYYKYGLGARLIDVQTSEIAYCASSSVTFSKKEYEYNSMRECLHYTIKSIPRH